MKKIIAPFIVLLLILLYSCQKDGSDPTPVIPQDTVVNFLPTSISYTDAKHPDGNAVANFIYSANNKSITVKFDYPQSDNPYVDFQPDSMVYHYSDQGYLQKREIYDGLGNDYEKIEIERDGQNTINRMLVANNGATIDTFDISFTDSATAYKIMHINTVYRNMAGSDFKTFDEMTFLGDKLIKHRGWDYNDGITHTIYPGYIQDFDANDRLISQTGLTGYKTTLSYDGSSTGLDSLYRVLGGKDGYFISPYPEWPAYNPESDLYFYPLDLVLSSSSTHEALSILIHQNGASTGITEQPTNISFDFQNRYDGKNRIIETKAMNDGSLLGTLSIVYP